MSVVVSRKIEMSAEIIAPPSQEGIALVRGGFLDLNPVQFSLLALMHTNEGKLVRYPDFQRFCFASEVNPVAAKRVVDTVIPHIRAKISAFDHIDPRLISHIWEGYALRDYARVLTLNYTVPQLGT